MSLNSKDIYFYCMDFGEAEMALEQEINVTDRGVAEPKRFWE